MKTSNTLETQALLPVTQADRDAAAEIAETLLINSDLFPALIRNGEHDAHPFVQSYARHNQRSSNADGVDPSSTPTQPKAPRYETAAEITRRLTDEKTAPLRNAVSRRRNAEPMGDETLLRAVCDAQEVAPYRGWNLTALNKVAYQIREHLGLPSIRDLNPDIAAMQDAAEVSKDAIRTLTTPPTPDRIGKDAVREALAVGERFLNACNSAWAAGEPSHRVVTMLNLADEFRAALDRALAQE